MTGVSVVAGSVSGGGVVGGCFSFSHDFLRSSLPGAARFLGDGWRREALAVPAAPPVLCWRWFFYNDRCSIVRRTFG